MSGAWLRSLAKREQIRVVRRASRPGVDWTTVEAYIVRSRIRAVDESLRRHADPGRPVLGVSLMDRVQSRFGWSDYQLARALAVMPTVVSRYRRSGVPDFQASRLRRLSRLRGQSLRLSDVGSRPERGIALCRSVAAAAQREASIALPGIGQAIPPPARRTSWGVFRAAGARRCWGRARQRCKGPLRCTSRGNVSAGMSSSTASARTSGGSAEIVAYPARTSACD
jgi:hypothetical protein